MYIGAVRQTATVDRRRLVVGAVIVDSLSGPTRFVAARRTSPYAAERGWEFPGGKVEPGETPVEALVREIREELAVLVRVGDELLADGGAWTISETLELRLFLAEIVQGDPVPRDSHDAVQWLTRETMTAVHWLPADRAALHILDRMLQ